MIFGLECMILTLMMMLMLILFDDDNYDAVVAGSRAVHRQALHSLTIV